MEKMTPKEAIEAIKIKQINIEGKADRITKFFEGLSVANSALEKQIPKKLVVIGFEKCCPVCQEEMCSLGDDGNYGNYCLNCGQALDWSEHNA